MLRGAPNFRRFLIVPGQASIPTKMDERHIVLDFSVGTNFEKLAQHYVTITALVCETEGRLKIGRIAVKNHATEMKKNLMDTLDKEECGRNSAKC